MVLSGGPNADMVLVNGRVITVDPEGSVVESVAVKDGRILATGPASEVMGLAGEDTEVVDLGGKTVLPGIIDTHTHPSGAAVRFSAINCRSPPVKSIKEILDMIAAKAAEVEPGEWIRCVNYNDIKLVERRHITRWEIDEAAPENPVFISKETGHLYVANSKAFELAGVTKDTPDPPGGKIDRTEEGEPTGLLYETAGRLVMNLIPPPSVEEITEGMRRVWDQFTEWGITTTHDASGHRDAVRAYRHRVGDNDDPRRQRPQGRREGVQEPAGRGLQEGEGAPHDEQADGRRDGHLGLPGVLGVQVGLRW
jgi:predicted amidohydrolase YtcJ